MTAILLCFSCNSPEPQGEELQYKLQCLDDYAFSDSTVKVAVTSPSPISDTNELCLHIKAYLSIDSSSYFHLIPISLQNKACTVSVPIHKNFAWVEINVSDKYSIKNEYSRLRFAVLNKINEDSDSLTPVKNASLWSVVYSTDSSWKYYCNTERKLYPENIIAYVIKWFYLMRDQQLNKKDIIDDINEIQKAKNDVDFVKFIAYSLIEHDSCDYYLKKVLHDKSIKMMNDELISGYLNQIVRFYEKRGYDVNSIMQKFALNYPLSPWTRNRLNDLSWISWNEEIVSEICQQRLVNLNNDIATLSTYVHVLINQKDKQKILLPIINQLYDLISNPSYSHRLNDPYRSQYVRRNFHYLLIAEGYKYCSDYEKSLRILSNVVMERVNDMTNAGIAAHQCAKIYQIYNQKDSVLMWYARAYYWNYDILKIRDSVFHDLSSYLKKDSVTVAAILDSLKSNAINYQMNQPIDFPLIELANSQVIDIKKLKQDIIIEFTSINCQPCLINIRRMKQLQLDRKLNDVTIVFVTMEDSTSYKKHLKDNIIPSVFAANANYLYSYFNVVGTPVTIRINKNGKIVYRREGGGKGDATF